jgi:phage/plasmid-associated DNA primase
MTCNHKYAKKYDPPIAWELYTEQRDRKEFLCEKCNTPCESIAFFEETEQLAKANDGNATTRPALTRKVALLVQDASEEVMTKYRFLTIEETKEILVYDNGVYKTGGEILIAKVLEAEYGYELNNNSLSQIIGHVMRRTYHKRELLDGDINIINLKNGLYNLKSGMLELHTPDHFSINQKPITYNKDAKPRLFFKFLSLSLK